MSNKVELDLNLNTLVQFRSTDFQFRVVLGVWAGRLSLTAFGQSGSRPVVKVLFNYFTTAVLRKYITKILKSTDPTKVSIDLQTFNRDTKENEYSGTIVLGRDKEGVCFLSLMDKNNKEGVSVFTTADNILVNKNRENKVELSEIGMLALDEALTKGSIGEVVTSTQYKRPGGHPVSNEEISASTGDEVPF